jgi:hypothetical protein
MPTISKQLHRPPPRLLLVHVQVQFQRFGDLAANRQHRVKRGHRVLKDHGDAVAANLAQLFLAHLDQVLTVKQDLAVYNFTGWLGNQADERHHAHTLAGTGFTYNRNGLAFVNRV